MAEFKEAFSIFDKDGDGSITGEELRASLVSLGREPTSDELDAMVREVDTDGNGCVDFKEFLSMMERKTEEEGGEPRSVRSR